MRSFDYVVVGAGSAGCVLAARLAEGDADVLLLEAGPPDTDPDIWNLAGGPRGQAEAIAARREVVLSAGTIGSAHILMLSGIGNVRDLKAAGIAVAHALRGVSRNLHDRLLYSVIFEATRDLPPPQHNFLESQLFCKSDGRRLQPDLQPRDRPRRGRCAPESCGRRVAASRASHRTIRKARRCSTPTSWRAMPISRRWSGPSTSVATSATAPRSPSGASARSCRMGTGSDAVVDPEPRVHGLRCLRIADASVMPSITSGNTTAPTIMIAGKAADMIRAAA